MSAALFAFEVHDRVHTPADTTGPVSERRRVDGANCYRVDGRWWAEGELERATPPAARPLLDDPDIDLIIDALGHLAGSLADRGNPTWTAAAELRQRLDDPIARLRLTVLATAYTMHDTPTGTE
jgi:hypothetical protein